nr:unnamed protein product [Callosobruchus chinensis]
MNEDSGGPGPPSDTGIAGDTITDKISNSQPEESINNYDLNNKYLSTDKGPYFVYMEHKSKNLGRLFPIKVGHFLQQNREFKNDILDIQSIGLKRVKVVFRTYSIANKLIQHELVVNNDLVAFIPHFFTSRKGVIFMVDTFFKEDYLKNNILSSSTVVAVKRLKKKTFNTNTNQYEFSDRQMIVVTFLGNEIPREVTINLVKFKVEPFIHPVVQCFRCLRYGHTASQCKGKEKCQNCSEDHIGDGCEKIYCVHCKSSEHNSISKKCPMYTKQYNIKRIMAFQNKSFKEAESLAENPSYISTNNRFSVLNTIDNFPELPPSSYASVTNSIRKPSFRKNYQTRLPPPKKRKTSNSQLTPGTSSGSTKISKSQPVIPNPYRDEFIQHKESMVLQVSSLIINLLNSPAPISQKDIQERLSAIFDTNTTLQNSNSNTEVIDISNLSDEELSSY